MRGGGKHPVSDLLNKLKKVMLFRVLFTTLLLGSTVVFQLRKSSSFLSEPLLFIYGMAAGILILSVIYTLQFHRVKRELLFTYLQVGIDTVVVTLIIYVTGGSWSIFTFLYLLVIIYSSMLLVPRGTLMIAAMCSIQYGLLMYLELWGVLEPYVVEETFGALNQPWSYALYKFLIIMTACFAVAFLSSILSEQERKTKRDLMAMETHVKRVQRMAAIGEMAAGLAHEIKNPLASLTGSIQLLREDLPWNPGHDKLMQIVLREADRLSSLVNDFLLFAKPPVGKPEPIALESALNEILELFAKDSSGRGRIAIAKRLIPNVWIEMDRSHLRQVLWNLLLNAAESIAGSGSIDIRMTPPKNRFAGIRISDTGCGIPEEIIQSIYDPFFTTKPSGTGLGLSIVHRILESYSGWLEVESEVGKGTTFVLNLKQLHPSQQFSMELNH